jgi:GWxTD domain-containing protein
LAPAIAYIDDVRSFLGACAARLRSRTSVALLAGASVLILSFAARGEDMRAGGDFEFCIDKAAFLGPDGKPSVALYVHVSNSEIRFKKKDGAWEAKVVLYVQLQKADGPVVLDDQREFEFFETDEGSTESPLRFQTITMTYALDPGEYVLSAQMEDINSPRVTLVGLIRHRSKSSSLTGAAFSVPRFDDPEPNLSDPQFLWNITLASGKKTLHPNPPRMYGLYNDTLRVYYELYLPADARGAVSFSTLILNQKGEILRDAKIERAAEDSSSYGERHGMRVLPVLVQEDLNTLPAGTYTLFAQFSVGDRPAVRIRGGKFSVAWEMRSWETSRRNMLAEARFLLDDEEYERFKDMNRADQEKKLAALWKNLDPDPSTGVNEAFEEFLARLAYVNSHYSDYQMGIFTDRGLIYMKYGKPDEIVVDVIPMNRETTADAIANVVDRFHPIVYSTHGTRPEVNKPTTAMNMALDKRRVGVVGEGGNVAFPYELWVYNQRGNPILQRDKAAPPDLGLRFIFIDREGYGSYRLEVSSSIFDQD